MIQATTSPVIWQDYLLDGEAHTIWMKLEARYGKAGGATTYLQLVNMVNIRFTDLMDLLPQIQQFQGNHTQILSNSHSQRLEDLVTFIFCSHLPESYNTTTQKYLDNVADIVNYKLLDIIA